jgi:hypothetical protein
VDVADDVTCCVCLDDFDPDTFAQLPCQHMFCFSCIKAWRALDNKCPLCKREIKEMPTRFCKEIKQSAQGEEKIIFKNYKPEESLFIESIIRHQFSGRLLVSFNPEKVKFYEQRFQGFANIGASLEKASLLIQENIMNLKIFILYIDDVESFVKKHPLSVSNVLFLDLDERKMKTFRNVLHATRNMPCYFAPGFQTCSVMHEITSCKNRPRIGNETHVPLEIPYQKITQYISTNFYD